MKILRTGVVEEVGELDDMQAECLVKIAYDPDDPDDTGGYYLFFWNADSQQGYDYWFFEEKDVLPSLDEWKMKIRWDEIR